MPDQVIALVLAIYGAFAAVGAWSAFGPESPWARGRRIAAEAYAAETARIQARRQKLRDGAFVGCRMSCYGT